MMKKNKGHWRVGSDLFETKIQAILEAQKRHLGYQDVSFHYNDEYWDRADWSVEPDADIHELYLQRAQQLRSQYKTLILRFSGGSDSQNILWTFLNAGIQIDVIIVNEYLNLTNTPRDQHQGSYEKIHVVDPILNDLDKQGYNYKKIYADTSDFYNLVLDPEWIFKINAPRLRLSEIQAPRTVTHPSLSAYNNKETCIISGIDKPQVWCKLDKLWHFSLPDILPCLCDPGHNEIVQEPFYWTADMPEISIKQSHLVKNFFKNNLDKMVKLNDQLRSVYEKSWLVPLLYPQVYKFAPGSELPYPDIPTVGIEDVNDGVADYNYEKNRAIYQAHQAGIDLADQLINESFKNKTSIRSKGLKTIYTKPRWLGK
jgi:hypothetical protein